ncbi:MAG: cation transporter [Rhodoferax sp.]|nr:cation transporter [Rhodoferax sp.]PIW07803.1 MAG: cation transporter [Comamonadaceae bacterium CG17_big_fil_post_rev_8_21_14_2_50_60_13]PJC11691.1 MAG: cation transporter [Comamonadaceae bacterium CG_4_9_14_0_8_um_filter_60_18]
MTTSHDHTPAHVHDQDHNHGGGGHGHSHAPANFNKAFAIGIALNIGFVLIEAFYGWRINSLALLADAGHNLSDVAGLVLAWGGALAVKLLPNARHTYGWKRATILAAFANALLLLVAMGALAWEAIDRLSAPQAELQAQGVTIMVVAGIGIVVNTATALLFMRGGEDDLNIRGAFLHMAADALVSAGVVVAGALTLWMGWVWLDPVVSLLIAAVILWGTWDLFKQSLHLLFDGVPDSIDPGAVRTLLLGLPGVADVHDLHVWAMGTSHIALTAHLVTDTADTAALLHEAEEELHEHFEIRHVTLQLETPVYAQSCALRPGLGCQAH